MKEYILITQEQLPMVAIPSMNDTHLEETIIVNKLQASAKAGKIDEVTSILQELLEHTTEHFHGEEKMMQESAFPAFTMHKTEHDRHLHELNALIKYFDKNKDTKAITAYVDGNLVRWLLHHIETMDTVTALHIQKSQQK